MDILVKQQCGKENRRRIIHIDVQYRLARDGVCHHCGRTGISRIVTLEFPVDILRSIHNETIEQIKTVAILAGHQKCQIDVGLTCLDKFFALWGDTWNRGTISQVIKAVQRIEKATQCVERLRALDPTRVASELWAIYHPIFEPVYFNRANTTLTEETRNALRQCIDTASKHPWCKLIPKAALRTMQCHMWTLLYSTAEWKKTLLEIEAEFREMIEQQYYKNYNERLRDQMAAETLQIYVR